MRYMAKLPGDRGGNGGAARRARGGAAAYRQRLPARKVFREPSTFCSRSLE